MSVKLTKSKERKNGLLERIELAEEHKQNIINTVQELLLEYKEGRISYYDYKEKLDEVLGGKTAQEWIDYYDSYIENCKRDIKEQDRKIVTRNFIFIFFSLAAILVLIAATFYAGPTLVGLIVREQGQEFTHELNLEFSKPTNYEWKPENLGVLGSLKISGEVEGKGSVRIYLGDLLILDSDNLEIDRTISLTGSAITGFTSEGEDSGSDDGGGSESGGDSSGGESGDNEDSGGDDSGGSDDSEDSDEGESSDDTEDNLEDSSETDEESQEEQEEESEEETEEETPEEDKESDDSSGGSGKRIEIEIPLKVFEDICEETCDLSGLNLNEDSYTLRIEISNAKLELDTIIYEIIGEIEEPEEEVPKEEPAEKIPEEEIIPEENITEVPEINVTEEVITNVTEAPILIQEIPNREIKKNSFSTISINEYFSDAEQFFILQVQNITTTTYDHTVELKPDQDFLGTRTLKIIASNEFGTSESNSFNITVSVFVEGPILIKEIPDIYIQKNSFVEINISEYFEDVEQFFLLQVKNISSTTFDHTVRLEPDTSFIGERKIKIIAVNALGNTESNFFDVIVGVEIAPEIPINITIPGEVNISTLQYKAVINRPQKWIKVIEAGSVEDIKDLRIKLPKEAENITVKTGAEVQEALLELEEYEDLIEQAEKEDLVSGALTGNVAFDIKEGEGLFSKLFGWFKGFTVTGNVIQESELQEEITETVDSKIIDVGDIAVQTQETEIAVEYYTAGPIAVEQEISRGKRVIVSSTDEENYTDILVFAEIPEKFSVGQEDRIKIYWHEEDTYVDFNALDLDNNGKLDYVEWITPHLSNQTYSIILITKAEHLDVNRDFISDIFEEVKELDGNWSETIPSEDYVRVVFEVNLTSNRDITIYPRTISGTPRIEVYEVNQDVLIAEFTSLTDNEYNKVFLTNLQGSQDTFDLRVIDGDVEFDHIIDPVQEFYEDCVSFASPPGVVTSTSGWAEGVGGGGACQAKNTGGIEGNLTSEEINLAGETSANLTFTWDVGTNFDANEYLRVFVNSSVEGFVLVFEYTTDGSGTGDFALENNITLDAGVHVRFACKNDAGSEDCAIDDLNVTSYVAAPDTAPDVTINSPKNVTYSDSHMPLNFNVTLNENGSVMYSLDGGIINITMSGDEGGVFGTEFNATNDSIADGTYTFSVYANDTGGLNNYTESVVFSVDQTIPDVAFVLPTPGDGSSQSNLDIYVNISSSDASDHYAFVDFDSDLFLWMRMDDVVGGNLTDLSSYSNNGTVEGDAFQNTSGRFGFAFQFDGINEAPGDAINVSSLNDNTVFNGSFSVATWVKPADLSGAKNILGTVSDGSDGWMLSISNTDKPLFQGFNGTGNVVAASGDAIVVGTWAHIVGVYNITVPDMKIYVDGVLKATETIDVTTTGFRAAKDFRIGFITDAGRIFNGSIDEVLLFNRTLGLDEVIALNATKQYENNFTGLSVTAHTFTGYAVDVYGNKNQTEDRSVTITAGDADPPLVTINDPANTTFNLNSPILFNVTTNEDADANYTLDGGINNITMQDNGNRDFNSTNDTIADGTYTAIYHVWDTAGNINTTESVVFSVDQTPPDATINFPTNITYGGDDLPLNFNVSLNENGSVMYSLDDGINNITMSGDEGGVFGTEFNASNGSIADGGYTFQVYANDTAGNNNFTESIDFSVLNNGRSGCDTLGTAGTTYTLLNNISTTNTCFQVTADDITLDGNGFYLFGDNATGHFGANASNRDNFTVQNIVINDFDISVSVAAIGTAGASGGKLIIINSSLDSIDTSGTDEGGSGGKGGDAGSISIFESNMTNITAMGGNAAGISDDGGNGGNVIFENTDINLTNSFINITGGKKAGGGTDGSPGTLTLNYSRIFDDLNADYGTNLFLVIINSSLGGIGEIKWIPKLDSSGLSNLSINTEIRNNSAFVNSSALPGLNVTANITFFNMPGTFTDPVILINSTSTCDATTSPTCSNFTSLNAATVIFNVSAWDVLNFSIGENPSANAAPTIDYVSTISSVTLTEGPAITEVHVNFTATDSNGFADLDSATASVNFTLTGEITRSNSTCAQVATWSTSANYTCNVTLFWFDGDGSWGINATIDDLSSSTAENTSQSVTIDPLTGFVVSPTSLTFATIDPGSSNNTATNDPFLLNNTGNQNITDGNIDINATNLLGEQDNSKALYSGNFSVGLSTGSNVECAASFMNDTSGLFAIISGAVLTDGNFTINDNVTGQEQLFVCLTQAGSELSQQAYSTSELGAWTIRILLVAFVPRIRRRKKKRLGELSKEDLLDVLDKKLKERKEVDLGELLSGVKVDLNELLTGIKKAETKGKGEKINIPLEIFKQNIGPAEALCKYLKENKGLKFSEIAKLLNRDQRTIGLNYRNALRKKEEKIVIKEKGLIPVDVFSDRKLSVLESLVYYLREGGFKNEEIARILDKDPRNVWTLYSRAVKKLHSQE